MFVPLVPHKGFWLFRGGSTCFRGLINLHHWFSAYILIQSQHFLPCWCWGFSDHTHYLYFSSERAQQVLPSQGRSTAEAWEAFAEPVAALPLLFLASCPQSPFNLLQMKFKDGGGMLLPHPDCLYKTPELQKLWPLI